MQQKKYIKKFFALRHQTISLAIFPLVIFVASSFLTSIHASESNPYYDDPFFGQKGGAGAPVAFHQVAESVDPFNGNVNLTHTDISLPGNGGLNLKVVRSYNSRIWGPTNVTPFPSLAAQKDKGLMGIGWSFHFGRIRNPEGITYGTWGYYVPPTFELPDGSSHPLYRDINNTSRWISKQNWRYEKSGTNYLLTLTDGTVYTFTDAAGYTYNNWAQEKILQVSRITDANGNVITFNYNASDPRQVTSITDSVGRVITFEYVSLAPDLQNSTASPEDDTLVLKRINVNGQVYRYDYQAIYHGNFGNNAFLTAVVPPVGPSWRYEYRPQQSGTGLEMAKVTYPTGAELSYTYTNFTVDVGTQSRPFSMVYTKRLSGRGMPGDVLWDYYYTTNTDGDQETVVTQGGLNGCSVTYRTEVYTFKGMGTFPNLRPYIDTPRQVGGLWQVGLLLKKRVIAGSNTVQEEHYVWEAGNAISNNYIFSGDWGGTFLYETSVYAPRLVSKTASQEQKGYLTSYSSYDNYNNPGMVSERGGGTSVLTGNFCYLNPGNTNCQKAAFCRQYPNDIDCVNFCADGGGPHNPNNYCEAPRSWLTVSGGGPVRTTTATYSTDATLLSKNIVSRPLSRSVAIGSESFTTSNTYDSNGNLTSSKQYGPSGITTTFGYTNGNLTSHTLDGKTTTYTYDKGAVNRITNPLYAISRAINWGGKISSETDGRGNTTYFTYDALNRPTRIDSPLEDDTLITYDNSQLAYQRIAKGPTSFTQNSFDGLGRVIGTENNAGIKTMTTYNTCGLKGYQSYPYTTTAQGDNYNYDLFGRLIRVTHPDGTAINTAYTPGNSGNGEPPLLVTITNERGMSTTYGYTAFGSPGDTRLSRVTDATGNTTQYQYNTLGNITGITHPNGLVRSFTYNTNNQLAQETHPEAGAIAYGYDASGNVTSRTDGKGTATFTYDNLNRLTAINYPGTTDDSAFVYDNADNPLAVTNSASSLTYEYDMENRLRKQTAMLSGRNFITQFNYDSQGNLNSLIYPTGRTLSYSYDAANRVTALTGFVNNVSYDATGSISALTYSNGVTTSFSYDSRQRLDRLTSSGNAIAYDYNYDGAGNITSLLDLNNSSKNRSMGYDAVDRLTSASGGWGSMSFSYDGLGNRRTKAVNGTTTSYNYDTVTNRLTSMVTGATTASFGYDANGNITDNWGLTLAYDAANRLTGASNGTASFVYDGAGKRIKKINNSTAKTTLYLNDPAGNVLVEADASGIPEAEYIYLNGQHVARIEGGTPGSADDTDGDGMPNDYELTHGLNPGDPNDANADADSDGITNLTEYHLGTNPRSADAYFTDGNTVIAGLTIIKAQHIYELRQLTDAIRASVGLPGAPWTDTNLAGQIIRSVHMQELRDYLTPALQARNLPVPSWIDTNLSGQVVKAVHLNQLRSAAK